MRVRDHALQLFGELALECPEFDCLGADELSYFGNGAGNIYVRSNINEECAGVLDVSFDKDAVCDGDEDFGSCFDGADFIKAFEGFVKAVCLLFECFGLLLDLLHLLSERLQGKILLLDFLFVNHEGNGYLALFKAYV